MPSPSLGELLSACAALGLVQALVYARFLLRLRAGLRGAAQAPPRPVSVIVPCKGEVPGLARNLRACAEQDYGGELEVLAVAPSREDPAYRELARLEGSTPRLRVLVSGAEPLRCPEQNLNLVFGAERASTRSELLVFADCDLRPGPSWLREMTAPLADPEVGLATTCVLPAPSSAGLWALLRALWIASGIPYLELLGCPVGTTLAMRREDYRRWGVARLWAGSFGHDLPLLRLLRRSGKGVRFVASAMPGAEEDCGRADCLRQLDRWLLLLRLHAPRVWLPGLLATGLRAYLLFRALYPSPSPRLLAALWAADAAPLALLVAGLGRLLPERFRALPAARRELSSWAVLASPLLQLLHLRVFLKSLVSSESAWGGYSYLVRGPGLVEALHGEARALEASRRTLRRLCLAAAGGILGGLAYHPGPLGILSWAAFVPLLAALSGASPSAALALGWLHGAAAMAVQSPWLPGSFASAFGLPPAARLEYSLAVWAANGLKWALPSWAAAWASRRRGGSAPSLALAFVPAMVAADGLFPMFVPTRLAESQLFFLPLVQSAELWGPGGLAWLILSFNAAAFLWLDGRRGGPGSSRGRAALLAAAAAAAALNAGWGARRLARTEEEVSRRLAQGRALAVALVQGPFPPDPSLPPGRFEQDLGLYNALSRGALEGRPADLLVWPETVYAPVIDYGRGLERASAAGLPLREALRRDIPHPVPLLVNAIGRGPDGRERNVSLLAGPDRRPLGLYEKSRLFPFGEYLPLEGAFPRLRDLSPRTARLAPGAGPTLLELPGKGRLGVLICYEDLFPEPARRYALSGAGLLVAQTNDFQFGRGLGPRQHLAFSALRAVETRRFLVRAAHHGSSAVIAPTGRVLRRLPAGARGHIAERVAMLEGETPAARLGGLPYQLALAAWGLLALGRRRA